MKRMRLAGIIAVLMIALLLMMCIGCDQNKPGVEPWEPTLSLDNDKPQGGLLMGALGGSNESVGPYDPFYTTIPFSVAWDDHDDLEGFRPDAVTVRLYRYEGDSYSEADLYEIAEVRADGGWQYTFVLDDPGDPVLLKSSADDQAYQYAIVQAPVDHYTETGHKDPVVKMAVTQDAWEVHEPGGEAQTAVTVEEYPATYITVKGTDGKYYIWTPEKLSPADQQILAAFCADHEGFEEETFENTTFLTGYGSYDALGFAVSDKDADFDDPSLLAMWAVGSYTRSTPGEIESKIINYHAQEIPDLREAVIKIEWDDNDDADGIRPSEVKATLSNGTQVTVSAENDWTAIVQDLPVYDGDKEIEYTWTEDVPDGYELAGTRTEGTETILTNKRVIEKTEATVKIAWDDKDNQDGIRPTEVKATLSNGMEVTLNSANGWSATVNDLPKYKGSEEIKYTWTQGTLPEGYKLSDTKTEGTVTTFTDSYTPGMTEATVKIAWDDKDNQDGLRPAEVKVKLSNGAEVTLNAKNEWTAKVENLPRSDHGTQIAYTWALKDEVKEYKLSATRTEGTVTTLTVTHTPALTEATVKVVWDDGDNEDAIRPAEVKVKLSDGKEVTLNSGNSWTAKAENLPKYKDGKEIAYTWTLSKTPDAYKVSDTKTDGTVTTLTVSHKPATTEAAVQIVWDDKDNQDGIRPAEVKVKLSNGTQVVLNAKNSWTAKAEELAKLENGKEVTYTWTDPEVPGGYTLTKKTEGVLTTLTLKHEPETTEAEVQIVWNDNDNRDGLRPQSITVKLSDGTEAELKESNGWSARKEGLPKYTTGTEIIYTWTQSGLPADYRQTSAKTRGTVTTLTDTLITGTEPSGNKSSGGKAGWIVGGSVAGAAVLAGLAYGAWKILGKKKKVR